MTDPGRSGGDGRRQLSRRKILWGLATTGAAASAGGGTAALFTDTEEFDGQMTAGTLDLETAWGNETVAGNDGTVGVDGVPSIDLGTVEAPASGTFYVNVAVSDNPAYVCFHTKCPGEDGERVEEAIQVTVTLEENGTVIGSWDGSLHEVRQTLGSGECFDEVLAPDEKWRIVVDWEVPEDNSLNGEKSVTFDFGFHAEQTRHAANRPDVSAVWPNTCDGDGHNTPTISNVGFCTEGTLEKGDIESVEISDDGRTLEAYELAGTPTVREITIKYGNFLDVFEHPHDSETFTVGTGEANHTYHQHRGAGNAFLNSDDGDTGRTVSDPCLGNGAKWEDDS